MAPIVNRYRNTPVAWGAPLPELLMELEDGGVWARREALSAWEIIRDNFEDDHCRCFMLWMAFQTVTPPEWPMTGRNAYSLAWGRQRWSWCIPKGGSGMLTEILVRLIEDHGGVALTNKRFGQNTPYVSSGVARVPAAIGEVLQVDYSTAPTIQFIPDIY